jgi:hypothetical protein
LQGCIGSAAVMCAHEHVGHIYQIRRPVGHE